MQWAPADSPIKACDTESLSLLQTPSAGFTGKTTLGYWGKRVVFNATQQFAWFE
jgi:hypothetical protein